MAINDKALKLSNELNVRSLNKLFCLSMRADIHYKRHQYDKALAIYKQMKHTNDSISTDMSNEQIEELKEMSRINNLKAEEEILKGQNVMVAMVLMFIVMIVLIGIVAKVSVTFHHLKKTEKKTADALNEANINNLQKEQFFNTMSKAIRTPLQEVMDKTKEMMNNTSLSSEQRSAMAITIQNLTDRLMFLVTGVLDLSRLEAGMTKWQIANHDFIAICRDAIAKASIKWPKAHYSLDTTMETYNADIDAPRMQHVIESMLVGTIELQHFDGNVTVVVRKKGEQLYVNVEGSPLDFQEQNEITQLRKDVNRLTLDYFHFCHED